MGINAISCESYADVKESGLGNGCRSASDFDGADLLKGAALVALMAAGTFVAGCLGEPKKKEDEPVRLEYGKWRDRGVDATLDAKQVGDKLTFHSDLTGADYKTIFRGIIPENGTLKAHFDIARKDPVTGSVEKQHIALEDYLRPETHNESMSQYRQLTNGSTELVASLNFEGNKNFAGLKIFAYADIKNDREVGLSIAEGHLKPPLECSTKLVPVPFGMYVTVAPVDSCKEPKLETEWGE